MLASMGPRSFNRGNAGVMMALPASDERLQWGRGLSTAEMGVHALRRTPANSSFNGAAVFQPRKSSPAGAARSVGELQWGRGLSTAEIESWGRPRPQCLSFNGAAVFQPRKWLIGDFPRRHGGSLQWGRGLSTAEIIDPRSEPRNTLQWGRGLSTAEMSEPRLGSFR